MTNQLHLDAVAGTAPLVGQPVVFPLYICPVRDKCLLAILAKNDTYRCGWEQAGSVMACHKRGRLET